MDQFTTFGLGPANSNEMSHAATQCMRDGHGFTFGRQGEYDRVLCGLATKEREHKPFLVVCVCRPGSGGEPILFLREGNIGVES